MSTPVTTKRSKVIYVEILRIIAIVFVVFHHTNYQGYVRFTTYGAGSFPYWICMVFSVLAGISVPLFFMISGMLLLGKEDETIGYVWKKRILKYLIVLLLFSLWRYIRGIGYDFGQFSVTDLLTRLYSGQVTVTYWFLYAYIAFLIQLPFLRKIAKGFTSKEFCLMLAIQAAFNGVFIFLQYRMSAGTVEYPGALIPVICTNTLVFHPLTGYYLGKVLDKVTTKMCLISLAAFLVSVAATMYLTDYRIKLTGDLDETAVASFFDSFRAFEVIFIFLIVRKLFEGRKLPKVIEALVISLGGCVFGIYLIETVVREDLISVYLGMSSAINGFVSIWIYVLLVVLVCWVIVAAVRFVMGFAGKLLKRS